MKDILKYKMSLINHWAVSFSLSPQASAIFFAIIMKYINQSNR